MGNAALIPAALCSILLVGRLVLSRRRCKEALDHLWRPLHHRPVRRSRRLLTLNLPKPHIYLESNLCNLCMTAVERVAQMQTAAACCCLPLQEHTLTMTAMRLRVEVKWYLCRMVETSLLPACLALVRVPPAYDQPTTGAPMLIRHDIACLCKQLLSLAKSVCTLPNCSQSPVKRSQIAHEEQKSAKSTVSIVAHAIHACNGTKNGFHDITQGDVININAFVITSIS